MEAITRLAQWAARFVTSVAVLGLANTVTIFITTRFSTKLTTITLPDRRRFHFRGRLDKGVMSHFYKDGYLIRDTADRQIARIVDVGANIGDETARFRVHHRHAGIIAVEAADENYRVLEKNFAADANVTLVHGGLWPVHTNLKLIPGDTMEAYRVTETVDTDGTIAAYTVPDLMAMRGWDRIDILKLDIEGAEYELFTRHAGAWIDKVDVFIFEAPDNDRPGTTKAIFHALADIPFNTFICGENLVLIRTDVPWTLERVVGFGKG